MFDRFVFDVSPKQKALFVDTTAATPVERPKPSAGTTVTSTLRGLASPETVFKLRPLIEMDFIISTISF